VNLSPTKFLFGCVVAAGIILGLGLTGVWRPTPWVLAGEVFATIIALFVLGSIKYRLHKNALTYGAALIIVATFMVAGSPATSAFHKEVAEHGWWHFFRHNVLSFHGLDKLVHADTMLFILGLTFFVAVIAQTRLLEWTTMILLRKNKGAVLPTVIAVTAVVSVFSGILDGVSMIGLTIRTLVIILLIAAAPTPAIRYAVMVCTVITTVCGMWLAYGEPPNLIMKANVREMVQKVDAQGQPVVDAQGQPVMVAEGKTLLTDGFFLRYCAPAAVACYLVVAWNLRRRLRGQKVDLKKMDVLDEHAATVRFLQAERHGEVMTPIEFVENHAGELGEKTHAVLERMRKGEVLGIALVRENVPPPVREKLLGKFVAEELAKPLDNRYVLLVLGDEQAADEADAAVNEAIHKLKPRRMKAQQIGALALIPFIGLLVAHALNHSIPLFCASLAGFIVAFLGIANLPRIRKLALHEARHEYAEYYFLFPLFLSITLLADIGFFNQLQTLIREGAATAGATVVALAQFVGCTFLSAMLDNNVVADFAGRALLNLDAGLAHLFAMSQIAGYAAGGCWTHIGSAQAVVAFAFILRDVDETYTPFQWIKEMTPLVLQLMVVLMLLISLEGQMLKWLH
jgi:Na+/H+ antiporter NhaD/arsenite permease-like protein